MSQYKLNKKPFDKLTAEEVNLLSAGVDTSIEKHYVRLDEVNSIDVNFLVNSNETTEVLETTFEIPQEIDRTLIVTVETENEGLTDQSLTAYIEGVIKGVYELKPGTNFTKIEIRKNEVIGSFSFSIGINSRGRICKVKRINWGW